ncbi:hypothetical protein SAY87_016893 [Trapa incisa]|uniref:Uncharacterized protein n=1 Tax=Trapa incisa TaxID=236973 RepID=A0AAN7LII2_9MYRT|nr:hypothetical protein SAY87_016893 [Trapa incisa]
MICLNFEKLCSSLMGKYCREHSPAASCRSPLQMSSYGVYIRGHLLRQASPTHLLFCESPLEATPIPSSVSVLPDSDGVPLAGISPWILKEKPHSWSLKIDDHLEKLIFCSSSLCTPTEN